jgi:anti-sigma factor RsiW
MREHPTTEQLELYVLDALSRGETLTVELHVAECAPCARRLAREASLELALDLVAEGGFAARADAAREPARPSRPRGARATALRAPWRLAGGVGAAFAVAMCGLLWLGRAHADDRAAEPTMSAARDAEGHVTPTTPPLADRLDGG